MYSLYLIICRPRWLKSTGGCHSGCHSCNIKVCYLSHQVTSQLDVVGKIRQSITLIENLNCCVYLRRCLNLGIEVVYLCSIFTDPVEGRKEGKFFLIICVILFIAVGIPVSVDIPLHSVTI